MLSRVKIDSISDKPLKTGTLLVNEGLIREADLAAAIEIQQKESRLSELAMGKLLVKQGLITKHQLQALLEHPDLGKEVGTFAIERERITPHQLAECLQKKPRQQPLAEALMTGGHLRDDDLKVFFEQQLDSLSLCRLAVQTGMISDSDVNQVLQAKRGPRTIGEILCHLNLITPLDLNAVLTKFQKHLRLGEILLKHGLIDKQTFDAARQEHEHGGEPLGSILRRKGILSEDQLFNAFAIQYNIPFERLDGFAYDSEQKDSLTKIVGKTFSDQMHLVPLNLEDNTLTVAISTPVNLEAVHSLRSQRVDLRTRCILITPSTRERLSAALYNGAPPSVPREKSPSFTPPDPPPASPRPDPVPPVSNGASDDGRSPDPVQGEEATLSPEQLVHRMLRQALTSGAEAIHINQDLRRATLRFRIGGILRKPTEPWLEDQLQAIARPVMDAVKEISGLDAACGHRPQEGAFRLEMARNTPGTTPVDFAVASCPTLAGENMTIRRIHPCPPAPGLADLSHSEPVVSSLTQVMSDMSGMVLVAASPGNDRDATLYGMLRHLCRPGIKAVTVDDATAFSLPEAVQIQTNPAMGLPCAAMLRAALRLDPDVLLVGDLADQESAKLGLEAARKGILLLGGMDAADAAGAVAALDALGMEHPSGCLKAVLAQRYVRKICPECRHTYRPGPDEWQPLFEHFPERLTFHKGAGCPDCNFSGYQDRLLLSELIVINDGIARAMRRRDTANDIRHLIIRSGIRTLIDDGLSKLDRTTLSEILDAVPPEATEAFKCNRADATSTRTSTSGNVAYKITFAASDMLKADIQRLHHAYEVLVEETGQRRHRSGLAAFETFIKTHHDAICRHYSCTRVVFSVERQAGKVILLAAPEP